MTTRSMAWMALMLVGCTLSALITLQGLYIAQRIDFRLNTVLTTTYCLLPILCFPMFFFLRRARRAALLFVFACAFWAAFSALNWRTCAELAYCGSVASTVLNTLTTKGVLAFFGIVAVAFALARIDRHRSESML